MNALNRSARWLVALLALGGATVGCEDLLPEPFEYGSVEVETVRRNGEPVPGVRLTLFTGTRHLGYGVTDERGRYRFEFVPMGNLGVQAAPPPEFRPVDLATGYTQSLPMGEGDEASVQFTYLRFGEGSVLARARTEAGEPAPGIRVQIYTAEGVVEEAVTNASGEYRFTGLPLGVYGVFAFPSRRYQLAEGGEIAAAEGLLIDAGHEEQVLFRFRTCQGRIRVEALDTDGRPVTGLRLRLYTSAGELGTGVTGADGVHTFEALACDDYAVLAEERPGLRLRDGRSPWWFPGLLVEAGAERTVTLTFTPCTGRITVRAGTPQGDAVPGARVVLYSPAGFVDEGRTDAAGRHVFSAVGCGSGYGVMIEPPSGYTATAGRGGSYVDGLEVREASEREIGFTLRPAG